jgi:hypothetical protein
MPAPGRKASFCQKPFSSGDLAKGKRRRLEEEHRREQALRRAPIAVRCLEPDERPI